MELRRASLRMVSIVVLLVAMCACASTSRAAQLEPDFRARAVTRIEGGLRVSVAVLSDEESERLYGVPLASKSIQPVWISIENHADQAYYLMFPGIDPNFFLGDLLYRNGDYAGARQALTRALKAPPRPERPLADQGRRKEIEALLAEMR